MSRYTRPARRSGWGRLTTRAVALVVAAVLAGATGVAGTSAAVAATPAAASPGTFTVVGTVQAEARTGVTVTPAVWDPDVEQWTAAATSVAVNATTGAFALKLPAGSSRYTLLFETKRIPFLDTYLGGGTSAPEDDTLGKSVFSGAAGSTKTISEVKLVAAGVIEGVITDSTGAPIAGGLVSGLPVDDGFDYPASTTTAANGSYYLAVERNQAVFVDVTSDKYQETYFPGTEEYTDAKSLSTNSANSFHLTGVDLTIKLARPSVYGAFNDVDDVDGLTEEEYDALKTARTYIYPVVNGVVSSIPAQTAGDDYEFDFEGLTDGDYVLAFRDPTTNAWIPATSNTGTPKIGSAVAGNGCLVPLTLVRGHNVDLGALTLGSAASSPCGAPWGTGAVFSGKVTNWVKGAATGAVLYHATSVNDVIEVDRAAVTATGTYSFPAITTAGTYFVNVTAGAKAPYFDTAQGGYYLSEDNIKQILAHSPTVAAGTGSTGNDVALIGATIVTGTVTGNGKPLSEAYVIATQLDTPGATDPLTQAEADTDKAGHYSLKVRTGSGYALGSQASGYDVQYFDHKADVDDATLVTFTKVGRDSRSFNFDLIPTGPVIAGIVVSFPLTSTTIPEDAADLSDLKATLYRKVGSYYTQVAKADVPAVEGIGSVLQFPEAGGAALVAGKYHVRFSIGKRWIPVSEYYADILGDGSGPTTGATCFIPITLAASDAKLFVASLDLDDKKTKCGDEPVKKPIVSTGSSGSNPAVISWPADPAVIMAPSVTSTPTATPTPSVTPTATAEPTVTPEPSATASDAPVASPQNTSVSGNLAWIYVVGGIILAAIIAALIIMVARRQAAAGK